MWSFVVFGRTQRTADHDLIADLKPHHHQQHHGELPRYDLEQKLEVATKQEAKFSPKIWPKENY